LKADSTHSYRPYIAVFVALMALTALTTAISFVDLGVMNTAVAITIAVAKATLVVLVFMHVRHSGQVIRAYAVAGVFWLILLFILILSDYRTRAWLDGWE
jgi:cytochrome c oxidase subunit 4